MDASTPYHTKTRANKAAEWPRAIHATTNAAIADNPIKYRSDRREGEPDRMFFTQTGAASGTVYRGGFISDFAERLMISHGYGWRDLLRSRRHDSRGRWLQRLVRAVLLLNYRAFFFNPALHLRSAASHSLMRNLFDRCGQVACVTWSKLSHSPAGLQERLESARQGTVPQQPASRDPM